MTVLYISQNGVSTHIGSAQVLPYLKCLANIGFKIHLLSAEPKEIKRKNHQRIKSELDDIGINWSIVEYSNNPPFWGPVSTQLRLRKKALEISSSDKLPISFTHCRGYVTAIIGYELKLRKNLDYIFDFRDFTADGGLQTSSGLKWLFYTLMKAMEKRLLSSSAHIVCLTQVAKKILLDRYPELKRGSRERITVIPCCADFNLFDKNSLSISKIQRARAVTGISVSDTVLLYMGSLGPDYLLKEMLQLFSQLLKIKSQSKFLFLTQFEKRIILEEAKKIGIGAEHIICVYSERENLPEFIELSTLAVFFYRAGIRSAGCSPTKLGEIFAMNKPVICNSGIGDLDNMISPQKNGSVIVKNLNERTLFEAVSQILRQRDGGENKIRNSVEHLKLESGVAKYRTVYEIMETITCHSVMMK